MTRDLLGLSALALTLTLAHPSTAGPLPFTGTLKLEIFAGLGLPSASIPGSDFAAVNASMSALHVSELQLGAGGFRGFASIPLPSAVPFSGLALAGGTTTAMTHLAGSFNLTLTLPTGSASNAGGAFSGLSGASGGGIMPLRGVAIICLFDVCSGLPNANLVIPLSPVGQGGTVYEIGAINLTAVGAPWTGGTAVVGNVTRAGFGHGPASLASTSAQPSGVISLVAPVFITTSVPTYESIPSFATLELRFVPEPGTLLLLGLGIAGLAHVGRARC